MLSVLAPCVHGCFVLAHIDHCVSLENSLRAVREQLVSLSLEDFDLRGPFCCMHILATEDSVDNVVE